MSLIRMTSFSGHFPCSVGYGRPPVTNFFKSSKFIQTLVHQIERSSEGRAAFEVSYNRSTWFSITLVSKKTLNNKYSFREKAIPSRQSTELDSIC